MKQTVWWEVELIYLCPVILWLRVNKKKKRNNSCKFSWERAVMNLYSTWPLFTKNFREQICVRAVSFSHIWLYMDWNNWEEQVQAQICDCVPEAAVRDHAVQPRLLTRMQASGVLDSWIYQGGRCLLSVLNLSDERQCSNKKFNGSPLTYKKYM